MPTTSTLGSASDRARPAPRPTSSLRLVAADGVRLEADVFVPAHGAVVAKALVAPAMGVRRGFYARFAADLARHGIATATFDYRGIGGSLDGGVAASKARLSDWGELDLAAATSALAALDLPLDPQAGGRAPLLFVGHSVGGQLFGLMRDVPFDAALFVGSQAGYFGHWSGVSKLSMAALWHVGVPLVTKTLGYLPMKALGQGENIPGGVAREWAAWGRDRRYVGVRVAELPHAGYATWGGPLRALAITDDPYAPRRAVDALVRLYTAAWTEVVEVAPSAVGARSIGHFGWFSERFRDTLWADARTWLVERGRSRRKGGAR